MKRILFIVTLACIAPCIKAELMFDRHTGGVYSKNASRNVSNVEYNALWIEVTDIYRPRGFLDLAVAEWAVIFAILRAKGTPTAKRLVHDLEKLIKSAKKDIKRINNL